MWSSDDIDESFGSRVDLNRMSLIHHGPGRLYLTSAETAKDGSILHKFGIGHIICIRDVMPKPETLLLYSKMKIGFSFFEIHDDPDQDIKECVKKVYSIIGIKLSKGKSIILHCRLGVSRSATAAIYFHMRRAYNDAIRDHKMLRDEECIFGDSYQKVWRIRRQVDPNEGFISQLMKLALELRIKCYLRFNATHPEVVKHLFYVCTTKGYILDVRPLIDEGKIEEGKEEEKEEGKKEK